MIGPAMPRRAKGPGGPPGKTLAACSSFASMTSFVVAGPASSRHEHELLSAAQRGDRRAQEELLGRYEPLVRATVRRLRLPARVDSEDIAQEARVGLLSAIRGWRPDRGPFAAFTARCVRNQAIKALNTAGAEKHKLLSCALSLHSAPIGMPEPDDQAGAPRDLDIPSRMAQPEATLLAREQLATVCAALAVLTRKERLALSGTLNGRSHRELAEAQGVTPKAVSLALRRARDKLAQDGTPRAA
jgi:RNA polymerase sporulation-specific sigma factor